MMTTWGWVEQIQQRTEAACNEAVESIPRTRVSIAEGMEAQRKATELVLEECIREIREEVLSVVAAVSCQGVANDVRELLS